MTYLPIPNNVELNYTGMNGYFERLFTIEVDDNDVYGISKEHLINWARHNFNSMFILNKELSLEEYKKLIN